MKQFVLKLMVAGIMLVGLPLTGITFAGYHVAQYLEFPPKTHYIIHAPFSWKAFIVFLFLFLLSVVPVIIRGFEKRSTEKTAPQKRFPWWGWVGVGFLVVSWTIAWTRIPVLKAIQEYTFTPLWLSYIIIINAVTYNRTGKCMMLNRPVYFLFLFPFSAVFWWFFEYLNRFVQNWYYVGVYYGTGKYILLATLSFSTVLPAVLGTRDLLLSTPTISRGFQKYVSVSPAKPKMFALFVLLGSATGLGCIGIFPDYLFPLLWVSPLLIILSLHTLLNETHLLSDIVNGDWRGVVAAAFSALICGMCWEMWNYYSLAKWEYSVPLVHRFMLFEMPILGYAGYLPFGLECAVMGEMIDKLLANRDVV